MDHCPREASGTARDHPAGRRCRAPLALRDTPGILLTPAVRRRFAPRDETPIPKSWDRHDRIAALSAMAQPTVDGTTFASLSLCYPRGRSAALTRPPGYP